MPIMQAIIKNNRARIAKIVKDSREGWNYSQKDLAMRTGLSHRTIQSIEYGNRGCNWETLIPIMFVLNIDTKDILTLSIK